MIRRWMAGAVVTALLLVGCAKGPSQPQGSESPTVPAGQTTTPPDGASPADEAAGVIAAALGALDVSKVPMQSSASDAQADLELIFAGMDGAKPKVTVGTIGYETDERAAKVPLKVTLDVGVEPWSYETQATLKWVDGQWRLVWDPAITHPKVTKDSRMRRVVTNPKRAPINDLDGLALVEEMSVFEVGIDKANVNQADWGQAARDLAVLVDQDPAAFEKQVLASGPKQFVVAATLRQEEIPAEITTVPGAHVRERKRMSGPSDGFAASILGTVGSPTAEMIEKSDGKLTADDTVGLSGLQHRYDEQLGGVRGVRVELVPRKGAEPFEPVALFSQEPSVGAPITVSLQRELQTKAEEILATQSGIASIVAIDLASGGVAVAANSPAAGTYPHATFGKYAPGSTFKVASALALVRKGKTAGSTVDCPASHTVRGHKFNNYPGFSHTGTLTLADAIAYSCNTAFTQASAQVTGAELHAAAGSLGVGTDYDAGFTSYFGTVDPKNEIDRAASMIGQGQVTMSPLGMAAVAASVAKGQTVIPWLVKDHQATSTATPLTQGEAAQLQAMMKATVDHGTGKMLQGVALGAKSGTAEWGPAGKQQTHAWMIAYDEQYAVAAFVEVGDSGGTVAAPLIKQLLG